MTTSARTGSGDPLWRLRWWLFASGVSTIAGLVVVKLYVVQDTSLEWQWPLFVWGVVVGLLGAVCLNAAFLFAFRLGTPKESERIWARRRQVIYTCAWLFIAAETGMVAAMFDVAWPIIAVAAYTVLVFGAGGILLARKARGTRS